MVSYVGVWIRILDRIYFSYNFWEARCFVLETCAEFLKTISAKNVLTRAKTVETLTKIPHVCHATFFQEYFDEHAFALDYQCKTLMDWRTYSPVLNSCDFFLCDHWMNAAYKRIVPG